MADVTSSPRHARYATVKALIADNPLLLAIAGIGFAVSFQTIARAAEARHMPGWPILYPVLLDCTILALVIEARRAVDDGRSDLVPRLLAWLFAGFTLYVNAHGSAAGDWVGIALHVAAPVSWVVFLELSRWRKVRRARAEKTDRLPLARWLFTPWRTLGMKKRMVLHHVTSYRVAVAREEALLLAKDLVRAAAGRRWRKTAPALLRHHLATGTLPETVSSVAASAVYGTMPAMAEPVSEWVTDALTQTTRMAVKVKQERRVIETAATVSAESQPAAQPAGQTAGRKAVRTRAEKAAEVRRLLSDDTQRTRPEIAAEVGVSVATVSRIKREMPTPLHGRREAVAK
jgi:hypothetical protein